MHNNRLHNACNNVRAASASIKPENRKANKYAPAVWLTDGRGPLAALKPTNNRPLHGVELLHRGAHGSGVVIRPQAKRHLSAELRSQTRADRRGMRGGGVQIIQTRGWTEGG